MIVLYILLLLCVLYILALQGRRNHPLWSCFRAQRFAHRGYHDKPQIPENSLPRLPPRHRARLGRQSWTCIF